MFEAVKPAPADTILGLTEAYEQDPNPKKINLGAGVYKDEQGNTPILECVRAAERLMLEEETTKTYLPIGGSPAYARLVQELIFGEQHPVIASGCARTVHTPGGTAALRVGADFLHQALPKARIWVSDPTWANHRGVFEAAGFPVHTYTYYDAGEKALDFERMRSDLERIPGDDVVLLHVCCHNPTGVDPSHEQWQEIATIARRRRWMPLLDFAYQGFGSGLEQDRAPLALFLADGAELVVASSFSKNFGLYQERAGALTLVSTAPDVAEAVLSQVKRIIRVNYSNPPAHGGHVVETVLRDAALRKQWESEVTQMRERVKAMRTALVEGLRKRKVAGDFSFINRQNGMFSYSGLTDTQVKFLREQKSVYMVTGGRMNVAGITTSNITYLCDAIAETLSL